MIAVYVDGLMGFDEVLGRFDPIMGMKVHVEPSTNAKMFSSSSANFGVESNNNVDPCSFGLPGALSTISRWGAEWTIKIDLASSCEIAESSRLARKNYFYSDQPKNYQISQYDESIAYDGYFDIQFDDDTEPRAKIERVHMEENTGKLTHLGGADGRTHDATRSLVGRNRAGILLIEIVTKPILGAGERAPEVACAYISALRDLVKSLGVFDARMNQGSTRMDSSVSLRPIGQEEFGARTETKNINPLRSVEQTVRYKVQRQATVTTNGKEIVQETHRYQETNDTISKGCPKESQSDHRCLNDPDLSPVIAPCEWVEETRTTLSELSQMCCARIQEE